MFWYLHAVRRSVVAPLALLLPFAACRFDFDPVPAAAKPTDAGPDASPPLPVLACGAPPLFTIPVPAGAGSGSGAPTLAALAAIADGYNVLAVDTTRAARAACR